MSEPSSNPTAGAASKRRALRYVVPCVLLCAALAAGVWWAAGRRVWTDDRTIHVRDADASVREVLWTKPVPPGRVFNTDAEEYEPSVSPDGGELFFVRGKPGKNAEIYVSRRVRGVWTEPAALVGVNTEADELGPRLTPDGRFLLFYSDRPGGQGGYDVWAAKRGEDGTFAEPFNLGTAINSEFNEYSPAPTPDGRRLYFATNRKAAGAEQKEAWRATIRQSAIGDYDLFVAARDLGTDLQSATSDAATQPVTRPATAPATTAPTTGPATPPADESDGPGSGRLRYLSAAEVPGVNTPAHEGASCVSTAGDFLYFASNRPGGVGKFDLYRCRLRDDGTLSPPENLGREINTPENETDPQLAVGGFHLYFSSDREGELARGGYDLLSSESREVYVQRQPRAAPHLGWSWWVLLGGLLLLLPLLSYLRGWNDHRLNLIQKCMLVSLLLHVLLTIALSLVIVSKQIVEYVRTGDGGGMEGAVAVIPGGGGGGGGVDVGAEVRRQISDTPVQLAEPAGFSQQAQVSAEELGIAPGQVEVAVPGAARAQVEGMTVAVRMSPREVSPAAERVSVAAPTDVVPPAAPELKFDASMRVKQVGPPVSAASDAAPALRAAPSQTPAAAARQVALGVEAAGAPAGSSVDAAPHLVRPNFLSIDPGAARTGDGVAGPGLAAAAAAIATGTGPAVSGPSVPSVKVADNRAGSGGDGVGGATPVAVALDRQGTGGTGSAGTGPASIDAGAPAASAGAAVGDGPGGTATGLSGAPAPGPRLDAIASGAGAGAAPTPAVQVDALPGTPALAGVGTGAGRPGAPSGIQAPSPVVTVKEEGGALDRAAQPGGAGPGMGVGAGPTTVTLGAGPTGASGTPGPGTVGSGAIGAPVGPRTAGVVDGGVGPTSIAERAAAEAAGAGPLAGIGPATVPGPRLATAGPAGDGTAVNEGQLASGRLGPAGAGGAAAGTGPATIGDLGPGPAARPATGAEGPGVGIPAGTRPGRGGGVVAVPLNLEVAIAGPAIAAPEGLSQRSVEARKPLLEKMGGTKQSEDAVDRALAYLARQQEPDGRWTYVLPGRRGGRRGRTPHDMALTGLATLCFLASDHTPDKDGPYKEVVTAGVNFLIEGQGEDGDLRGPMAGGGADAGNMYDHGIATLALAEAGLMTGDKRVIDAAMKGAEFIVAAQNPRSGGWRYLPGEEGDTSIFGWQIMALHSAGQLGFEVPEKTKTAALRYVRRASAGRNRALGSYMPGSGPSMAMTAELLFSRILLGERLTPEAEAEASEILAQNAPNEHHADFYGMYYASLSLLQLQGEAWTRWNERTRDVLVRTQKRTGDDAGCWDGNITWADRGGRVFSTALGCLTLQVYYRYLPVEGRSASQPAAPDAGVLSR